jgi:hypothetical protein
MDLGLGRRPDRHGADERNDESECNKLRVNLPGSDQNAVDPIRKDIGILYIGIINIH